MLLSLHLILLVTSRNVEIASLIGAQTQSVDLLTKQEALALLQLWSGMRVLPLESSEIAKQCGYLPLEHRSKIHRESASSKNQAPEKCM